MTAFTQAKRVRGVACEDDALANGGRSVTSPLAASCMLIPILAAVLLGTVSEVHAQVPISARSPEFELLGSPDSVRGSASIEENLQAQANASRSALAVADQNLAVRGGVSLDAAYARDLQATFLSAFSPSLNSNRGVYATTVNDDLLSDPVFASNLKHLFQMQAASAQAYAQKRQEDIRIIGGRVVPEAIDVVALVGTTNGSTGLCSGTLIAETYVLTAAHCYCENNTQYVRVGSSVLNGLATALYPVRERYFYKDQDRCPLRSRGESDRSFELRVEEAVKGNDLIVVGTGTKILGQYRWILGAKAFAKWSASGNNYFVKAAGYGFRSVTPEGKLDGPGTRLAADIAIHGTMCSSEARKFGCVDDELVAQGHPAGQTSGPDPDTCNGDSGGPIYALYQAGGTLAYYTIGVTSRGISRHCGDGGIYSLISTRLSDPGVADWLKKLGAQIVDE